MLKSAPGLRPVAIFDEIRRRRPERHTSDADAVIAHVGEIGQTQPARRGFLPEDDVPLGSDHRLHHFRLAFSGWERAVQIR